MGIVILIMGALVIVAAIRDTHEQLFGALAEDLPDFMVWGAAVFAVGALGWIPNLSPVSRGLLALVVVVLVLGNYQKIIDGFSQPLGDVAEKTTGGDKTAPADKADRWSAGVPTGDFMGGIPRGSFGSLPSIILH